QEAGFLNNIAEIVGTGVTLAEKLLRLYEGTWNKSVDPVFQELLFGATGLV
ncbi:hypothetical protein SELMODRAFT_82698, partial [Selaginella moellendorffii]